MHKYLKWPSNISVNLTTSRHTSGLTKPIAKRAAASGKAQGGKKTKSGSFGSFSPFKRPQKVAVATSLEGREEEEGEDRGLDRRGAEKLEGREKSPGTFSLPSPQKVSDAWTDQRCTAAYALTANQGS